MKTNLAASATGSVSQKMPLCFQLIVALQLILSVYFLELFWNNKMTCLGNQICFCRAEPGPDCIWLSLASGRAGAAVPGALGALPGTARGCPCPVGIIHVILCGLPRRSRMTCGWTRASPHIGKGGDLGFSSLLLLGLILFSSLAEESPHFVLELDK